MKAIPPEALPAGLTWEWTDHACRVCGGRVFLGRHEGGKRYARCASCETTVEAPRGAVDLCWCGASAPVKFRCVRIQPTPEMPRAIGVKRAE